MDTNLFGDLFLLISRKRRKGVEFGTNQERDSGLARTFVSAKTLRSSRAGFAR